MAVNTIDKLQFLSFISMSYLISLPAQTTNASSEQFLLIKKCIPTLLSNTEGKRESKKL